MTEVHRVLESEGVSADSKAVANVLGYLSRTGKLRRLERGHYVVVSGPSTGTGLITSDEISEGNYGQHRMTEHDV